MLNIKKTQSGILMGFDYGEKHIGVALGQMITQTTKALTTLEVRSGKIPYEVIAELIRQWQPTLFVVGRPLNMDGTEQPITQKATQFASALHKRFHIPVEMVDERLTTIEAKERLFSQGGYKMLKKSTIDATSASIILESWMYNALH